MGGMEFNKIFAALLVAGITAMMGGFVAKQLVHSDHLEEDAYAVEVVEVAAPGAPEPMAEPILAMIGAADISRGEKLSKACAACHTFDKGGANGVGPNLWGTVGAKKEHAAGYAYSGALAANGGPDWSYLSLNKYLWKPKKYAPGTKMNYIGMKKPEDRAALIAWLRTLSDNPPALPSQADIDAEMAELSPPEPEEAVEEIDAIEKVGDEVIPAPAE